jgi:hypothetical protein
VIYVEAGDEKAVLACFEEGLRYRKLGAVVAEVGHLSVTASRRLQLTAEGFGVIGLNAGRSGAVPSRKVARGGESVTRKNSRLCDQPALAG